MVYQGLQWRPRPQRHHQAQRRHSHWLTTCRPQASLRLPRGYRRPLDHLQAYLTFENYLARALDGPAVCECGEEVSPEGPLRYSPLYRRRKCVHFFPHHLSFQTRILNREYIIGIENPMHRYFSASFRGFYIIRQMVLVLACVIEEIPMKTSEGVDVLCAICSLGVSSYPSFDGLCGHWGALQRANMSSIWYHCSRCSHGYSL